MGSELMVLNSLGMFELYPSLLAAAAQARSRNTLGCLQPILSSNTSPFPLFPTHSQLSAIPPPTAAS